MRGGPPTVSESEVKSGRAPCPTERATAAVAHDIEGQAPPSGGYAALDLPAAESSTAMPDTGVANLSSPTSTCTEAVTPTRRRQTGIVCAFIPVTAPCQAAPRGTATWKALGPPHRRWLPKAWAATSPE